MLELPIGEYFVALDIDFRDCNFRSFVDVERNGCGVRRNVFGLGLDRCVLPALFGQHLPDNDLSLSYSGAIVGRLHA